MVFNELGVCLELQSRQQKMPLGTQSRIELGKHQVQFGQGRLIAKMEQLTSKLVRFGETNLGLAFAKNDASFGKIIRR